MSFATGWRGTNTIMQEHNERINGGRRIPNNKDMGITTDPNDPEVKRYTGPEDPGPQAKKYLVLSEEERAKGFVRPVRRAYVHDKCGSTTTMGAALSETYARDPKFYGATYCCSCRAHFPVDEFVWEGLKERVGS